MPLECDINIAINCTFWVEVANPEHPFTAMLISHYRGTCLIGRSFKGTVQLGCLGLCAYSNSLLHHHQQPGPLFSFEKKVGVIEEAEGGLTISQESLLPSIVAECPVCLFPLAREPVPLGGVKRIEADQIAAELSRAVHSFILAAPRTRVVSTPSIFESNCLPLPESELI